MIMHKIVMSFHKRFSSQICFWLAGSLILSNPKQLFSGTVLFFLANIFGYSDPSVSYKDCFSWELSSYPVLSEGD